MKDVCTVSVEPDGLEFDPESITADVIADVTEYAGVRARIPGNLGPAVVRVQVDVGFGDRLVPSPRALNYPVLLDMPAPRLKGYSRESVIAEKLESIARFGISNSRLKDYVDIWLLSRSSDFEGETLRKAIEATFENRGRPLTEELLAQMEEYGRDESWGSQWNAFCRKNRLESVPRELPEVVASISDFIGPVVSAIASERQFAGTWGAPGPWQSDRRSGRK